MFLQKNSNTTSGVENKVTDLSISIVKEMYFEILQKKSPRELLLLMMGGD